jgi:hypothetical protein
VTISLSLRSTESAPWKKRKDAQLGIEQQCHHRQLGGRIGMREASADGSAVADRKVRHVGHGAGEHWKMPRDHRRGFQLMVPHQRPDSDDRRVIADERQARNAVDIDQGRGPQQTEIEHRDEALPARDDLGIASGQGRDRHLDRVGDDILKRGRLHGVRAFLVCSRLPHGPALGYRVCSPASR